MDSGTSVLEHNSFQSIVREPNRVVQKKTTENTITWFPPRVTPVFTYFKQNTEQYNSAKYKNTLENCILQETMTILQPFNKNLIKY